MPVVNIPEVPVWKAGEEEPPTDFFFRQLAAYASLAGTLLTSGGVLFYESGSVLMPGTADDN